MIEQNSDKRREANLQRMSHDFDRYRSGQLRPPGVDYAQRDGVYQVGTSWDRPHKEKDPDRG